MSIQYPIYRPRTLTKEQLKRAQGKRTKTQYNPTKTTAQYNRPTGSGSMHLLPSAIRPNISQIYAPTRSVEIYPLEQQQSNEDVEMTPEGKQAWTTFSQMNLSNRNDQTNNVSSQIWREYQTLAAQRNQPPNVQPSNRPIVQPSAQNSRFNEFNQSNESNNEPSDTNALSDSDSDTFNQFEQWARDVHEQ